MWVSDAPEVKHPRIRCWESVLSALFCCVEQFYVSSPADSHGAFRIAVWMVSLSPRSESQCVCWCRAISGNNNSIEPYFFFFSSLLVVPLWDSSALGLIVNWSKSDLQVNLLFATLLLNPLPRFSCAWLLAMTIEDEGTNQCDQATNVMDMHWLHV